MTLLSIIIPVYNIQDYLSQCLNSICNQSIEQLEVIIVNDGSTDNSGQIADSYAQKYDFIKVLHQSNQGVSVARNNGVEHAKGEYIWFVDGDDWIPKADTFNKIVKFINKYNFPEFIFLNMSYLQYGYVDFKSRESESYYSSNLQEDISALLKKRILMSHPCDKLVKRDFLLRYNLLFLPQLRVTEDYMWNIQLLQKVDAYAYFSQDCYTYRTNRVFSASTVLSFNKLAIMCEILQTTVDDIIGSIEINPNYKKNYLLFSSSVWFHIMPEIYTLKKQEINVLKPILLNVMSVYTKYSVPLKDYNRGAIILESFISIFGKEIGYKCYAKSIIIKRQRS